VLRDGAIYCVWFVRWSILVAMFVVRLPMTFRGGGPAAVSPPALRRETDVATMWDLPANVREGVLRTAELSGADAGALSCCTTRPRDSPTTST
jgi:hypothetical protein